MHTKIISYFCYDKLFMETFTISNMRRTLFYIYMLATLMFAHVGTTLAQKYVIYPIPHWVGSYCGTLNLTPEANVVCESTIDRSTRNRLTNILAAHNITAVFDNTNTGNLTLRLGTVGSGESVEAYAFDALGLNKKKLMTADKFDRHALSITEQGITIVGEHTNAVFYALASLEQILEQATESTLKHITIYDYADQQNRGLVEGYYGYPYSVEVKKDLMRFMMRNKMNTYMYGAKSDPYHSQMWKDPYPTTITAEQEKNGWLTQDMVSELSEVSEATKVNFIWAIHPGNDFLGSNTVIDDIMSKFEKMHALGVRHFGVFVDDVSIPSSDADMQKNATRLTELQRAIENKWNKVGAAAEDTVRPLHFVPQIYCNSFANSVDQRQRFMSALNKVPSYITVYSTGQGVWSVPNNSHTTTIIEEFGRPMGWWWNYPCNDNADGQIYPMDMYSNFLDMPAVGNDERLPSNLNNCQGIVANPMQQGQVAKTSLFSIADYAWNNAGFDNQASWEASFQYIIKDEALRKAYHDITYYLRWNEPQTLQTLIDNYKTSLDNGAPNATILQKTILKIKADCEKVITLKDSEVQSDRLLYADIAPWLHTLHTYATITDLMLNILDNSAEKHAESWLAVKAVCDSLEALDFSTLYTAYALEGMGNGISVSHRQAQLSRKYWYPFITYLKEKAIDPYFNNPTAITSAKVYSNSPLLQPTLKATESSYSLTMPTCNLDVDKYVGIALPEPVLIDQLTINESLLPFARYSSNGKDWKQLQSATEVPQEHIAYFIFLNETGAGIKDFSLNEGDFVIAPARQAFAKSVTIPDGNIYEGHTASLMVDGDYTTFTCLHRNQQNSDKYVLDLGDVVVLHDVRLCMGTVNGDYPNVARIQYSKDGKQWSMLKVKGSSATNWTINTKQNVVYSNDMTYCDFDGAKKQARYVRLILSTANTEKWLRLYEIEVNRQHAANSTLPACQDGNGDALSQLTDKKATTGLPAETTSPLTYSFNSHHDVSAITFYSLLSEEQPTICVTTDGENWQSVGTLNVPCQKVSLQAYPKAQAVRLEWQGTVAPAIYEIMPEYDVNTSSLPEVGNPLSEAFAQLKAQAIHALDSCGIGNKLITKNSQFSSPYTEQKEGSLNNLLDGNQSTFWHSKWSSGAVADGVHYLEISLPEATEGNIVMHFGRRSDTDGHHLIKAKIQGVVSGSGTTATTEDVATLELPYQSPNETIVSTFKLSKAYPAVRLVELETTGSNEGGSSGFFHIGEFQLYSTLAHYILKNAQAEAEDLRNASEPLPSEATEAELQALQAAYDAFMLKVFGIVPSGIDAIQNAAPEAVIYDIQGRRLQQTNQPGIYIINQKKVIVK